MKMRLDKPTQSFFNYVVDHYNGTQLAVFSNKATKKQHPYWQWYLVCLVFLSPLILFIVKFGLHFLTVKAHGYVALPTTEIRATQDGYVNKIPASIGLNVRKGDLLYRLELPELQQKENLINSELDYLKQNLAKQYTSMPGTSQQNILAIAKEQNRYSKQNMEKLLQLFNQGAATEAEVKFAKLQYEQSLSHLIELENSLIRISNNTQQMNTADNSQQKLRLSVLSYEKKKISLQNKALSYFSPTSGHVSEILVTPGHYVSKGDLILTLTKNDKIAANVLMTPEVQKFNRIGQTVSIVFPNGERLPAKVMEVSQNNNQIEPKFLAPHQETSISLELKQPVKQKLTNGLPIEVYFK